MATTLVEKGRRDGRRNDRGERGQDRFRGERNGDVVSVNLTIKMTALLMNVVAEIANVNPYLTAP